MAEPRECVRCHQIKIIKSRGLCVACDSYARKYGTINNYPKDNANRKIRYAVCIDCGEYTHIFGRDRCKKCHQKWYMSSPENKKRHAEREKQRRLDYPELYKESERKREQTEKRQQWSKKYNRQYYEANGDKLRQYQVEWRQNNKEQFSGYMREARQRRIEAEGFTTEKQWKQIVKYYCPDNKCLRCGRVFVRDIINRKLTQDHVIPINLGGTHWPDNMQPLCYSCNASKSDSSCDDYRPDKGEFARSLMINESLDVAPPVRSSRSA